jgi:UPF0288 family protein (methanogenesis marker protein 3)
MEGDFIGRRASERGVEVVTQRRRGTVLLIGRFKTEMGESRHMLPSAAITASGLQPRVWVGRMIDWYGKKEITNGPVFRNLETGTAVKASAYEFDILLELDTIQKYCGDIVNETVDVYESYGVSRSFRRGSNTHATNQGVSDAIIDHNNRWSMVERARGRAPKMGMQQHYADVLLLLRTLLKYSSAL